MRRLVTLAFALAAVASPLAAQGTHPDFSGKWKLDPKSVSESPMAPTAATLTVTQDAKVIKLDQSVSTTMGDQATSLSYNLDGSTSKNSVTAQGMTLDMTSTASWDGPALVVKTTTDVQGQTLNQTARWTLDADGKTLHLQQDVAVAGQSMSMKMNFTKM